MGRTSSAVKNRYNNQAYDRITLFFPKGRKDELTALAKERGESLNGYFARLVRTDLGLSEEEWKKEKEAL